MKFKQSFSAAILAAFALAALAISQGHIQFTPPDATTIAESSPINLDKDTK